MSKLYPPYIDSKLPAFYSVDNKVNIQIPFQMNRAVGIDEVLSMKVLIKTVSTNIEKIPTDLITTIDWNNYIVNISAAADLFIEGQYYKFQIAYINQNNEIGFYSTAGIAKYTAKPIIGINIEHNNNHTYMGFFETADISEKVYNYQFIVYDSNGDIFEDSGELIHNSDNDIITDNATYISNDIWNMKKALPSGELYSIQYYVKTINCLSIASSKYNIQEAFTVTPPIFNGELSATLSYDDGYIELSLLTKKDSTDDLLNGHFVLSRSSSEDNFSAWDIITNFTLVNNESGIVVWRDFTIKQGITYLYSIQLKNIHGVQSSRIYNKEYKIIADFEDMFLSDGERQLKIRFNPKVTSFKTNILENKTNTIGGQHPFFFRNGVVHYKEFPISGLISLLGDENELFLQNLSSAHLTRLRTKDPQKTSFTPFRTQLTTNTFQQERDFKLKVLEWLQNGKPKLFRSPGEGNYIIRLMNISFTPNDILSRMLHTFTATACEIENYSFNNIKNYGFLNIAEKVNYGIKNVSLNINENLNSSIISIDWDNLIVTLPNAYNLIVKNTLPNSEIFIGEEKYNVSSSGKWMAHNNENNPITTIKFTNMIQMKIATLEFTYAEELALTSFDSVKNVKVEIVGPETYVNDQHSQIQEHIKTWFIEDNIELGDIYYINVYRREVFAIERKSDGNFYYVGSNNNSKLLSFDSKSLYFVIQDVEGVYDNQMINGYYSTSFDNIIIETNSLNYTFKLTGLDLEIDLTNNFTYGLDSKIIQNVGTLLTLQCGNGLMFDIVYQKKTVEEV